MYSDLPVLMLTHRFLSWSGFMGEHFNVRGGRLYFLVDVSLFRETQYFPQMVLPSSTTELLSSNNLWIVYVLPRRTITCCPPSY